MELKLDQKKCSREVTGTYDHPKDKHGDSGKIVDAKAKGKDGKTLNGEWKSQKKKGGRGGFTIELSRNTRSFKGEYWDCRVSLFCTTDWEGEHHGA